MKIISFSGVDGSGKSTQRELLQKYLEDKGHRVAYFHATEFSLANRLHRKKGANFTPGQTPAVTKASLISVLLRLLFLTIDGFRFFFYQRSLNKNGVAYLLSDRFFQDSLINILFLSQNPLVKLKVLFLSWVLPKPDTTFYLKLSAHDIANRSRVPEQGMEYLEDKIRLYDSPPFSWSTEVLDATQIPENIHQEVIALLP